MHVCMLGGNVHQQVLYALSVKLVTSIVIGIDKCGDLILSEMGNVNHHSGQSSHPTPESPPSGKRHRRTHLTKSGN